MEFLENRSNEICIRRGLPVEGKKSIIDFRQNLAIIATVDLSLMSWWSGQKDLLAQTPFC